MSAALTLAPMDVVVCTDAKNAFGSILRSSLRKAALDACPKLAGVLQHLFGAGPTRMWAEQEDGGHQRLEMHRGTGQGGPESMPLYCLAAAKQCERLQAYARSQAIVMRQWMFVDDFIFQAAPEAAPQLVAEHERVCDLDGIVLVRDKRKAYWPPYAQAVRSGGGHLQQWYDIQHAVLAAMASAVQVTPEHITVLGNAVGGEYAVDLAVAADGNTVVNQSHSSPLATRSRRASKFSHGLIAMAEGQLAAGGKQPAWTVMRDCLANALSYDARVCNAMHYGPFAERLREEIIAVAGAIAGVEMGPVQTMQMLMRREEGGMGLDDPVASGARARIAAVIERGPDLRARLRLLYPEAAPEVQGNAEGLTDAEHLMQQLRGQGIAIGPYGLPQRVGILPQHAADAPRPPAPASHLHAAFSKQASLNMRKHMLDSIDNLRGKARLRGCGGPTAGRLFTSRNHASDDVMSFDDDAMAGAIR